MNDPRTETVERLAEPILSAESAELVELTVRRSGPQVMVKLLVDKPGGVTVQQCARINHALGDALETAGVFADRYVVEVSSPGLDRPLVSTRDFERAIGEQLDVQVSQEGSVKTLTGMLLSVQGEQIVLTTRSGNVTISLATVQRARKALPF